ncbi:MAG TPA: ATP-binding protein [Kofleriaceae bacterium]
MPRTIASCCGSPRPTYSSSTILVSGRSLHDEPLDLYEIIRQRYQHGSTIISSNRDVEEWYPLFGDALLASAAMDRLLHNAHVVVMNGDTYRNPPPAKKSRRANGRSAAG